MHATPGSLLIVGFEGQRAPADLLARLAAGRLGGIILFARNLAAAADGSGVDLAQVQALVASLRAAAPAGAPPPILSVDQEGGRVQRLRAPLSVWPPMARLAGRGAALAQEVGQALGRELQALGFNLDYAPVLDVHTNPQNPIIGDRAFGTTAAEVAQQALAFLRGLESAGVRGCGKHFPGHGDTSQDSHLTLPRVERPLAELRAVELLPFAAAVRAGVGMLMTAHVVYSAVDALPATLSPRWLEQILRQELGFEGVILSDDLEMGAVADGDVGEVIVASLLAGCDAFLICREAERQARAEEALLRAAERDSRVRARIAEATGRLLRFRSGLPAAAAVPLSQVRALQAEHQRLVATLRG